MTLTRAGIFSFIRGLFEGWFFLCLLAAVGISLTFGLISFIVLLIFLALILIDQTDNLWEIIGGVIGALLTIPLAPLDGGNAMLYITWLGAMIIMRYWPGQQKPAN